MVEVGKILGYGEESLTLWTLKQHISRILGEFKDKTAPSECLIFYRPSFGRRSRKDSSIFGEFNAIIVSSKNIYLIESKWDNNGEFKKKDLMLDNAQGLRHKIFAWYLTHWNKKYSKNWGKFVKEQQHNFRFEGKTIAQKDTLLATNLEFILAECAKHCNKITASNIKNILLFFHNGQKSKLSIAINKAFKLIPIDYSKEIKGNFVTLFEEN
ncbi:MAG: hypothetical protein QW270_02150 [Candidatus Bathyarchaeia archaeon]